jgi:acyl transferase domain-containing protein/ubiquinone/menaquinone biosynthesis C-methylase UbiE/acyl carrier protein
MTDNTQSSTAKQALAAIQQLQGRIRELENSSSEPIAVVGLGCRFPGEIHGPDRFWNALLNGVDGIVEVPSERWNIDEYYDPEMDVPGKMYTRYGGFIREIDQFDACFFGISPREALLMDPQQRLLLQTVWESFEYGGFDLNALYGSKTGVYVGISNFEYGTRGIWPADKKKITAYSGTGGSLGVAAGRLSYVYGFTGPSMIVDTACSSSLVTTHLAMQALRNGECDMAVSAGVNLILGPETHIYFCQGHMLAPDGHCKTFSSDANGYARGEGVGSIILKRLSDAEKDGDTIFAVLLGSAVNQDGPSGGLTVPNGPSQESVIKAAIKNARIKPTDVGYVEAHGTGTPLGDPIEISALSRVFKKDRDIAQNPLQVASVKTNIGHLESAAGIAGLIKTILSTSKGILPPHQNYVAPNPHIGWDEFPGNVVLKQTEWKSTKRIGGVSSFSFSGTNAHVLVSNYIPKETAKIPRATANAWPKERILTLSGHSDQHLHAQAKAFATFLKENSTVNWNEFCTSAALGRTHLGKRGGIVASSVEDAIEKLQSAQFDIKSRKPGTPRVAFQFTGQGAQYPGMGKELYEQLPVFKAAIDECAEICKYYLDTSLIDILFEDATDDEPKINNTRYTQPALFAFEYAFAKVLLDFGVQPDLLVGHSLGEFAAATISGVLSLEDAIKLVCARGRLMVEECTTGSMVSISLPAETVTEILSNDAFSGQLDIAGINTFEQVTVAGNSSAIAELIKVLETMGAEFKPLKISHAFHCHLAEPMIESFREVLSTVTFNQPNIELFTTIQGTDHSAITTPEYWCTHLRKPVDYVNGIESIVQEGIDIIIEVGPKPILTAFGKLVSEQGKFKSTPVWISATKKQLTPWTQLLNILSALYESGIEAPLKALYTGESRYPVHIPCTPFITESYWIEPESVTVSAAGKSVHPLLGELIDSPAIEKNTSLFRTVINAETIDFLAHHKVNGHIVLPAAAHVEIMFSAANSLSQDPLEMVDFEIHTALILDESEPNVLQVILKKTGTGDYEVQLFSKSITTSEWQHHSSCRTTKKTTVSTGKVNLTDIQKSHPTEIPVKDYYEMSHALGIEHGTKFQAIEALFVQGHNVVGKLSLPQPKNPVNRGFTLHPALLDAAFQVSSYALKDHQSPFLPVGAESVTVTKSLPTSLYCVSSYVGRMDVSHTELHEFDLRLIDEFGTICAEIKKLRFQKVSLQMFDFASSKVDEWIYDVTWRNEPLESSHAAHFSPEELNTEALSNILNDISEACGFYEDLFRTFDAYISDSIQYELSILGWNPQVGDRIDLSDLEHNLEINPTFSALFNRCIEILAEDGILSHSAGKITVNRTLSDKKPVIGAQLLGDFPQAVPETALLSRCVENLGNVLTGKTDPIQLLFPQDDDSSAASLYKNSVGSASINRLLATTLENHVSGVPSFKKLRVLEIGAGTGGTTTHVLPLLPKNNTEYWYTDISRHFLNLGKQRFSEEFPFVNFGLYDVEKDTSELPGVTFDIIIAANVLHATNDISVVMEHCKAKLKPGGIVVMLEAAPKQRWLDLTFGMTDGWWRFKSSDPLRSDYPLLSFSAWKQLLSKNGFESVEMVGASNGAITEALKQQVIVAQLPVGVEAEPSRSILAIVESASESKHLKVQFGSSDKVTLIDFDKLDTVSTTCEAEKIDDVVLFLKPDSVSGSNTLQSQHKIFSTLQSIVREITESKAGRTPKLWIIAAQAFASASSGQISTNWSLSGVLRSIRTEYPELDATLIDPGTNDVDTIGTVLKHELHVDAHDDIVQYHNNTRTVQRLTSESKANHNPVKITDDGSYLITGGFGPLGLLSAYYLAELGAKHIILMGRHVPENEVLDEIRARFGSFGATLHSVKGDVSNEKDVAKLFNSNTIPLIKGIIHSAGTLSDKTFENISTAELDEVMRAKISGTYFLHEHSSKSELDFFIAFSSIGALFGPTGQANYAAANAWMDQLMMLRSLNGLPGLSINWGAWSGESLANRKTGSTKSVLLNSINEINPEQGNALFSSLFSSHGQKVVVPFNHDSIHESLKNMRLLSEVITTSNTESDVVSEQNESNAFSHLSGVEFEEIIIGKVSALTAKVLGSSPDKIDPTLGFFDLGMDSLTSVELRNALQFTFGLSLPTTLIFKYPTIELLAEYLAAELSIAEPDQTPAENSEKNQSEDKDIKDLSEDELSALIDDAFNDVLGDNE